MEGSSAASLSCALSLTSERACVVLCRGGGKSGDHVDVLGNYGLLDILLSVAAGRYEEVEEKVVSNIDEIADKVSFPP